MHFKQYVTLLVLLLMFAGLSSCKKEGFGGSADLKGVVVHHDDAIPDAMVYIKFDAKESPGEDPALYDSMVDADSAGNYEFKGLEKGDYYLLGIGFDPNINEAVHGGVPIKLKSGEVKTSNVPVTEGD